MEFEKLKEIIVDVLNVMEEDITLETTFVDDLGADSLDVFQIIMGIEEAFDIEIENEDEDNYQEELEGIAINQTTEEVEETKTDEDFMGEENQQESTLTQKYGFTSIDWTPAPLATATPIFDVTQYFTTSLTDIVLSNMDDNWNLSDPNTLWAGYAVSLEYFDDDWSATVTPSTAVDQSTYQILSSSNEAAVYKEGKCPREYAEGLIKMLSCICPHVCEEMWSILGHNETIAYEPWPTYDEAKTVDDSVEVAVQVNGKLRATVMLPLNCDKDEAIAIAKADEKVAAAIDGKTVVKEIVIPNKIVNIVVK